jgi:hypothetical protein
MLLHRPVPAPPSITPIVVIAVVAAALIVAMAIAGMLARSPK